jgi:hypothetical protein
MATTTKEQKEVTLAAALMSDATIIENADMETLKKIKQDYEKLSVIIG